MARVLGESARYLSQAAVKHHERMVWMCSLMVGGCGVVEGICLSSFVSFSNLPPIVRSVALTFAGVGIVAVSAWGAKRLGQQERERMRLRRGAAGEICVGNILSDLPEDFYVINDMKTVRGNLDHIVVGPTGVFVLETKNWRGCVALSEKEELILNGQNTAKDHVRLLLKQLMEVRKDVRALASGQDPFYHAVIVFTSAWLDDRRSRTDKVTCLREDQVFDHIVRKKSRKALNRHDIQCLAQAFLGLAHIDTDFSREPAPPPPSLAEKPRGAA